MEYICELTADKQNEIRAEIERALQFFGYRGQQRERMAARYMDSTLVNACNLIGAYKWVLDNEQIEADILCGMTADSAIQNEWMD